MYCSMRMNAILPFTAQPCSRDNYVRTELAVKCWRWVCLPGIAYRKSRGRSKLREVKQGGYSKEPQSDLARRLNKYLQERLEPNTHVCIRMDIEQYDYKRWSFWNKCMSTEYMYTPTLIQTPLQLHIHNTDTNTLHRYTCPLQIHRYNFTIQKFHHLHE